MEKGENNPYFGKITLSETMAWDTISTMISNPEAYSKEDLLEALKYLKKAIENNELDLPFQPNLRLGIDKVVFKESDYYGTYIQGNLAFLLKHPAYNDVGFVLHGCRVRVKAGNRLRFLGPCFPRKKKGSIRPIWVSPLATTKGFDEYICAVAKTESERRNKKIGEGAIVDFTVGTNWKKSKETFEEYKVKMDAEEEEVEDVEEDDDD